RRRRPHRRHHCRHRHPDRDDLMGDPLFSKGIGPTVVLIVVIKTLVVFVFLLVGVLMTIWMLRKVMADMQDRIGPNRAGPYGLLQQGAVGIQRFVKLVLPSATPPPPLPRMRAPP